MIDYPILSDKTPEELAVEIAELEEICANLTEWPDPAEIYGK